MKLKLGLIALAFAALQTGCVSMSSLQTAETIEKGKHQWTVGGGTYQSKQQSGSTTLDTSLPYLEGSYREGLGDDLDAGLKLTLLGSYSADAKYRLVKGDHFQFSVGGGLGYANFKTNSGSSDEVSTTYFDVFVPLYASYRFTDWFAVYATPRVVYRSAHESGPSSSSGNQMLGGGAAGVKVGKDWGVYAEAAYQKDFGSDFHLMQYNVSLFWENIGGLLSGHL